MRAMSTKQERRGALVAVLVAAVLQGGCIHTLERRFARPQSTSSLDHSSKFLKAHMQDGELYVLQDWSVDGIHGVVRGTGAHYDVRRDLLGRGAFAVPISKVALFETNVEKVHPAIAALTVVTGLSLALSAACIAEPKSCFGSCPTVYVSDGKHLTLQAEAFSASVAPALEATDIDALFRAHVGGPAVNLYVTNEALETHVIRRLDLLAARRPPGGRVVATRDGTLRQALSLEPPTACRAAEGDCLAAVKSFDTRERSSLADAHDLATRETVDLKFDAPAHGPLGIVIGARQTFITTFVFYQLLAYLGHHSTSMLAALTPADRKGLVGAAGIAALLGGIDVQFQDADGHWKTAGSFHETGPIATDVQVVPLPAGARAGHIRLRLTQGNWRLNYVALARLGKAVTPAHLRPREVDRRGAPDPDALARLRDPERTLVTYPGDRYRVRYELPKSLASAPGKVDLFLDARGYYLEWMRKKWVAEQNLPLALYMLASPRQALKLLAPAFKKVEPKIEQMFWNSRYAPRK